ncbi:hypothetical protein C6C11_18155 [Aeromonas hydrophila]|uniref:Uncharacterized protein n=1 Tax=Aeromonas hydrophila TaxID=644 RepID=A0ABD7G4E9_AERHY|nr:hypothetical protein C6C11_18155 [Aeromonas hydrophila]
MPYFFLLCLINEAVIYAKTYLKINNAALKWRCFIYPIIFHITVMMKNDDIHIQKQTFENQCFIFK